MICSMDLEVRYRAQLNQEKRIKFSILKTFLKSPNDNG